MGFDYSRDGLLYRDAEFLKRAFGTFLHPLDVEQFPGQVQGNVIYLCADGHQSRRMLQAQWERCPDCHCDHLFTDHGIALCIAPSSPVAEEGESKMRLNRLVGAFKMKADLEVIIAIQHWPCGHASGHSLPVLQQFLLLAQAKDAMKVAFESEGMKVPERFVGFSIDDNPLIPKEYHGLYYFDRHAFNNFQASEEARERVYLV